MPKKTSARKSTKRPSPKGRPAKRKASDARSASARPARKKSAKRKASTKRVSKRSASPKVSAPRIRPSAKPLTLDQRGERLQKVLAAAGLGSRRQCEELILAGRVEVNKKVIVQLGTRVDTVNDEVRVDGEPLPKTRRMYYAVHKPDGVISTNSDPSGRTRVIDLLPSKDNVRMFTVGRLDLHSEGLILLTNDGQWANLLTHPRFGVEKVYRVEVAGSPTRETLNQLHEGIHLAEAFVQVPKATVKSRHKNSTTLEMTLSEGRNREIRRVLAKVGHKVLRLVRVAVGPVRLGTLAPGEYRTLSRQEVQALRRLAEGRK